MKKHEDSSAQYQSYRMKKINELYKSLIENNTLQTHNDYNFSSQSIHHINSARLSQESLYSTARPAHQAHMKKVKISKPGHTGFFIHNSVRASGRKNERYDQDD